MTLSEKLSLEAIIVKLALTAAGIVLLFSILNGYPVLTVTLRTVFSFFLIYFLGVVLLELWEKFSPPPPESDTGSKIDIILGDIAALENELDGSLGLRDHAAAATYSRRIPGQIASAMQNGLPDAKKQAEIIRRMGLEE